MRYSVRRGVVVMERSRYVKGSGAGSQVLIVGAGPSGLAAALVLARLGIEVRIIDKNSARTDKSKALAVQAGTLECLQEAVGEELVREMIGAGLATHAAWIHLNDDPPITVDIGTIPSAYNFILNLEQSETERILEQRLSGLSVEVERRTGLVDFVQDDTSITARIKLASGEIEQFNCEFMIGCDGSHSTVRHLLGIPFKGSAYTGDFILADVILEWSWPYGSVRLFVNEHGVIAAFPLRGEHQYRLIFLRQGGIAGPGQPDLQLDELRSLLTEMSPGIIAVQSASWLTRFRVHQRMVRQLQRGRIFLAGDAAHIHSPAGGQGMNTGIQDALNIGFKLAQVLAQGVPASELGNYGRERLPVARRVLRGTDFVSRLALLPESRLKKFVRGKLLPIAVRSRFIQRHTLAMISEVAIARREIRRYPAAESFAPGSPCNVEK